MRSASDREKFRNKIYENTKGIDEVWANALIEIAWNTRIISEMLMEQNNYVNCDKYIDGSEE